MSSSSSWFVLEKTGGGGGIWEEDWLLSDDPWVWLKEDEAVEVEEDVDWLLWNKLFDSVDVVLLVFPELSWLDMKEA